MKKQIPNLLIGLIILALLSAPGCSSNSLPLQKSFAEIKTTQTSSTEVMNMLPDQGLLVTDSASFAHGVASAVDSLLTRLPRATIARKSWETHGGIIIVGSLSKAGAIANRVAPEHLQICTPDPAAIATTVRHAGAIFLGATTPEAIGDYVGGPNHVLPTSGAARFSSGLSALDFMKRTTILSTPAAALGTIGPSAALLADAEGLDAHALSVRARLVS